MTDLSDALRAKEAALTQVLAMIQDAMRTGRLDGLGLENRGEPSAVDDLIQELEGKHARLVNALHNGDHSQARLAAMKSTPSALDLDQVGLKIRESSPLSHAINDLARAGLRIFELLRNPS